MSEGTGSRSRGQIALASGAAVGTCAAAYLLYRHIVSRSNGFGSTTASSGGGPARYEQMTAVEEYLQMHFAAADDIFPYENAPKSAVNFCERCALLVERHCAALKDFTGEREDPLALDIGCAVGGATFELTKCGFKDVLGIDYSRAFVRAADTMRKEGSMPYHTLVEGRITEQRMAQLPAGTDASRVRFRAGDACALPSNLAPVDAVLAANLLCRLPDPGAFLYRLPSIVRRGGCVVLTTPWSWLDSWTKRRSWLGGYYHEGAPVRSFDELRKIMEGNGFELRATEDMPFVIREHARKFQWGCAQGSAWVKTS